MHPFDKLLVWDFARDFVNALYDVTDQFPHHELFGLTSQIRRAGISIAANVAEGASRRSPREFARFLEIAIGSANEVHCLILIASDRGYVASGPSKDLVRSVRSLRAQLVRLQQSVRRRSPPPS